MRLPRLVWLLIWCFVGGVAGCGGGGSGSQEGTVIEGTLLQGEGGAHARLGVKHSAGQPIGAVEVCALGACSTTDDAGQWGFFVGGELGHGDVLFTIRGHGIDTSAIVHLPDGSESVEIVFVNSGGSISASSLVVNGIEQSHDESGDGHDHEHEAEEEP